MLSYQARSIGVDLASISIQISLVLKKGMVQGELY